MKFQESRPATLSPVDRLIYEMSDALAIKFTWLENVYGKCQRLVRSDEKGRKTFYPAVFSGRGAGMKKDYLDLFQMDQIGSHLFWHSQDPYETETSVKKLHWIKAPFSIIFWFDMSKILLESERRNIELIKMSIANEIVSGHFKSGTCQLTKIFERPESVYSGFTANELKDQFSMFPYACLRFDVELFLRTDC